MLTLGAFAFAAPWVLAAAAGLPILWWLLRVTPPAPKLVRFPAIRLLLRLQEKEDTPARTPWWLLLLRILVVLLLIVGLAHPLMNPEKGFERDGPLVIAVDNGWSAAPNWQARRNRVAE
ncbi:MAG: BatA domain-containing protein, partial [Rhodospirillaceae bacterium]|nr:BatA domain-containing protein [Rhodospirillaceae bacterium]